MVFGPKKEADNVSVTDQEIDSNELRALKILPAHKQLVLQAARLQHQLFFCEELLKTDPCWIQVLKSSTGGLRQVSSEWLACADNLLCHLGLRSPVKAPPVFNSASLAYRLGLFKEIERSTDYSITDLDHRSLGLRIRIGNGSIGADTIGEIQAFENLGLRYSLLASYVVRAERLKIAVSDPLLTELREWALASNFVSDSSVVRSCHILNSVNYVYFRRMRLADVDYLNRKIEINLAPLIRDDFLRAHVLGNCYFHQSGVARAKSDAQTELTKLTLAARTDFGFSDYHYRIAQIFHDTERLDAKEQYEIAIRLSPFNFSLLNDYGVFLSQYGVLEELDSWETVCRFFYKNM